MELVLLLSLSVPGDEMPSVPDRWHRHMVLARFPDKDCADDAVKANERYQRWLCDLAKVYRLRPEISDALDEAKTSGKAWHYLAGWHEQGAYGEFGDYLREFIGDKAFFGGAMPDAVPRWRLAEVP